MPNYWLMKSEPDVFSLDDLRDAPAQTTPWDGIRNYQARNFMRDQMTRGDLVLYYHSNCEVPGVAGLAEIASEAAYPDPTQFDAQSKYHDPKSTADNPRWLLVDVKYRAHFPEHVSLAALKDEIGLAGMLVTKRGQRLSIQPVEESHFYHVCAMGGLPQGT